MTSNRVGGPTPGDPNKGPDPRLTEQHRKIEKIEKVRAVDETENEHTRKKFQRFMEDLEPSESEERSPGPLEAEFYKAGEDISQGLSSAFQDLGKDAIASPSYSPPPDCTEPPESEENQTPPLPQSHKFWTNVDSPPDHRTKNPKFLETKEFHSPTSKKSPPKSPQKTGKESLYGPPGKFVEEKKEKIAGEKAKIAAEKEKNSQRREAIPKPLEEEFSPWQQGEKKKDKETKISDAAKKSKEKSLSSLPESQEIRSPHEKPFEMQKEKEEGGRKSSSLEIQSPSQNLLPATVIPMAEGAAIQATPYLNSQTTALFFQIVGTIYVMTTISGVSKTEILLNAPSFANSKFFGSTISIEKYATAPDSLNIRLTGTDEAVTTFNQNISSLYAAFQNGGFNFRIGRISAEYSIEKPLFKRKESREGNEGGDFSDQRGKK